MSVQPSKRASTAAEEWGDDMLPRVALVSLGHLLDRFVEDRVAELEAALKSESIVDLANSGHLDAAIHVSGWCVARNERDEARAERAESNAVWAEKLTEARAEVERLREVMKPHHPTMIHHMTLTIPGPEAMGVANFRTHEERGMWLAAVMNKAGCEIPLDED